MTVPLPKMLDSVLARRGLLTGEKSSHDERVKRYYAWRTSIYSLWTNVSMRYGKITNS